MEPTSKDARSSGESRAGGAAAGSPSTPKRRPIPLPPDSLRPPPRPRPGPPGSAPPAGGSDPASPVLSGTHGTIDESAQRGRAPASGRSRPLRGRRILAGLALAAAIATVWRLGIGGWQNAADPHRGSSPMVTARSGGDPSGNGSPPPAADLASGSPAEARSPAGTPAGGFALQVGSYRTRRKAEAVLRDAEQATGLPGWVTPPGDAGDPWFRILLGAFSSEEAAAERGRALVQERILDEAVVRAVPEG